MSWEFPSQRDRRHRTLLSSFTSLLGAGSQEVNHIQMMADVSQDLEFGHQSFVLTGCGPLCVRSKEKSGLRDNGAASALPWRLLPPCPGGCMPALLVCPCFINLPTFCERPSRQTVFIPPTLLGQHPLYRTEARCVDGVSHRKTLPFGGPGCADNVLTQSRPLTTSLSRGFPSSRNR